MYDTKSAQKAPSSHNDKKVKTGIEGLDKALDGGIPKNNIVLISGGAGTGKSTLCMQFLINGAKLYGEKGLYISTEQNREELLRQGSKYGWPIEELENRGLLHIEYFNVVKSYDFLTKLERVFSQFNPARLVVDSLTTLTDSMIISGLREDTAFSMVQIAEAVSPIPRTEKLVSKTLIYHLLNRLREFRVTALMTSELPEKADYLSADTITEFVCDGVVLMHYLEIGVVEDRSMIIRKMRYTKHDKKSLLYDMGSTGIEIKEEKF